MFKAIDATHSVEIVSIAPQWANRRDELRAHCAGIELLCPECRQSVRFRAGERVRAHFAHKVRLKCSMSGESADVLAVRAVLYEWLTTKFGSAVEIEKQDDLRSFPKPIDCWVTRPRGPLGYVVLARGMKSSSRAQLKAAIGRTHLPTTFVFHISTLARADGPAECVALNTTHRSFAAYSEYSRCRPSAGVLNLHYLDPESATLTTYRGLGPFHGPQVFRGWRIVSQLSEVRVSPKNGEFVHPGEVEALQQLRARKAAPETPAPPRTRIRFPEPSRDREQIDPEATCTICGQVTRDYWWHNARDKTCRCRECQSAGRH